MASRKEFDQIAKVARKQGWTIEVTRGGHRKWVSPRGEPVFSSFSPSDHRAIKRHIRELIKKGFVPKGMK